MSLKFSTLLFLWLQITHVNGQYIPFVVEPPMYPYSTDTYDRDLNPCLGDSAYSSRYVIQLGDTLILHRVYATFDTENRLVRQTQFKISNPLVQITDSVEHQISYDTHGRISIWTKKAKLTSDTFWYHYQGTTNLLDSIISRYNSTTVTYPLYRRRFMYNSLEQLTSLSISIAQPIGPPPPYSFEYYTYTTTGKLATADFVQYTPMGTDRRLTKFFYDSNDSLVVDSVFLGIPNIPYSVSSHNHTPELTTITTSYLHAADIAVQKLFRISGNLVKKESYPSSNVDPSVYEYEYSQGCPCVSKVKYYVSGVASQLSNETVEYFLNDDCTLNLAVNQEEADNTPIYPNPTKGLVYFTATAKNVYVVNMLGTQVLTESACTYLDMSGLPAGTYRIFWLDQSLGSAHSASCIKI